MTDIGDYDARHPVVFIIFKRPEKTRRVLAEIRRVEPKTIIVIADGPKNADDAPLVQKTRQVVEEGIDWDCDIIKDYADENLGCKIRISSGLTRAFETFDRLIILEDDCLPTTSFFRFCDELLECFADDTRIMQITGFNAMETWDPGPYSYFYSHYGRSWGWASWSQAWDLFDVELDSWSKAESKRALRDRVVDLRKYLQLKRVYDKTYRGEIDSWGYGWSYARFVHSGLSVVPAKNLVTNIGFGTEATHTTTTTHKFAGFQRYELDFPLRHNPFVVEDREFVDRTASKYSWKNFIPDPARAILRNTKRRLRRFIPSR